MSFESTYLKMTTSRSYQDSLVEGLSDPREAAAYLDAALEEGDRPAFLLAIRNVIEALGGMTQIARRTGLNRENLYRVLSEQGNPELNSLEKLLKALGLRLSVEVDQKRIS
jgi:probable addiction module antidote protein